VKPLSETQERTWMVIRVVAAAVGIVAPAFFFAIAALVHPDSSPLGENGAGAIDVAFYLLLILGIVDPLLALLIERPLLADWRRRPGRRTADRMFFHLAVLRMAFVEATFLYGFVYLLTWDLLMRMLIFYLVGLVWLGLYWPRREKYEQFIEGAERL